MLESIRSTDHFVAHPRYSPGMAAVRLTCQPRCSARDIDFATILAAAGYKLQPTATLRRPRYRCMGEVQWLAMNGANCKHHRRAPNTFLRHD
jgi:hypothetical protein